jgi:RNA polymerase sigma factor (sigma-70 family)
MNNGNINQQTEMINSIKRGGSAMQEASDQLYRLYKDDVLAKMKSTIRYRRGQQEDAMDLLQDAFVIMIDKIRYGGYQEGSLMHFWAGIANGLFKNKFKRDNRMDLYENATDFDRQDPTDPEAILEKKERKEVFDNLLNQLDEKSKNVMMLSMEGYSMKEIAEKLNLASDGMARKIKYNCKKELIRLIDELDIDF